MRRREFIAGLGSAAVWPLAVGGPPVREEPKCPRTITTGELHDILPHAPTADGGAATQRRRSSNLASWL
jgi:hypothetical protein